MTAWLNGRVTDAEKIVVSAASHTVGRGSALFEVMDIIKTDRGPALFRGTAHIKRLIRSAEIMHMPLPMSEQELVAGMKDAARASGHERGAIKVLAYYARPEFGIIPKDKTVDIAAFVYTLDESIGMSYEQCIEPVTAGISSILKLSDRAFDPHAKVAGHYVNAFRATWEAREKGYAQPILLDHRGMVTEGALCSLFMVKGGKLMTSKSDEVLLGITRDCVIKIAREIGVPCEQAEYTPSELIAAEEAFVSGSIIRIQPIKSIDGRTIGNGGTGPVTRRLSDVMEAVYCGRDERFGEWIEPL